MATLQVSALQAQCAPNDAERNLEQIAAAAREASELGSDLLITPEVFTTGYVIGREAMRSFAAQDLVGRVAQVARASKIGIIAGLPEADGDAVYNTAALIDADGSVLGKYRKTHLFGEVDRSMFEPGPAATTVVDFRGVRIAMLICYDVEFPENVRLAAAAGAHLVAVPTAQMEPYGMVADIVIRTRAWENQVYLAYVNHEGSDAKFDYVGRSSIVGPDGQVLADAGRGSTVITATVDTETVAAAQRANPYLADRRTDLY